MNIESFADWYIVNEIAKNSDANFFSSCYMFYDNGILSMGPIWDFDIAFGNIDIEELFNTDGFWVSKFGWYNRLFEDEYFRDVVRERFRKVYSNKNLYLQHIDETAQHLYKSVEENNKLWKTLGIVIYPNHAAYGSFDDEVLYLKQFLTNRMDWLNTNL